MDYSINIVEVIGYLHKHKVTSLFLSVHKYKFQVCKYKIKFIH